MDLIRYLTAVIARIFLSALFLVSGVNKIINWQDTEKEFIKILNEWETVISFSTTVQTGIATIMMWAPGFLIFATLLELLGGLLLFLGIKEKLGSFLLIIFLIPTTFLFHPFWFMEGDARDLQSAIFLRNIAILGGLLLVMLHGSHRKQRREEGFSIERMG